MIRPLLDRLVAALLALALLAAGGLVLVELAAFVLGGPPVVLAPAGLGGRLADSWTDRDVVVTASVLLGVGVALLLLAFAPRRPRHTALAGFAPGADAVLDVRTLETNLATDAGTLDGVDRARCRVGRRRVRAELTAVAGSDRATVRQAAETHLNAQLERVQLARPRQLSVHVRTGGRRVR